MSRGFVKDGDQEDVPVVTPRAFLPEGYVNYVTAEGLELLRAEREALVRQRDAAGGNESDRRVERMVLGCRLQQLEERISTAVIPSDIGSEKHVIGFGAYVTLRINGQKNKTFRIVGADEADASRGLVSYFSPVAKAIYGHCAGDFVRDNLPGEIREIEVVSVSYDAVPLTCTASPSAPAPAPKAQSPKPASPRRKAVKVAVAAQPEEEAEAQVEKVEKKGDDIHEMLPVVNERGITMGHAPRWKCHDGSKLLHPVVHLHLFNSSGELYLQKRPEWKDIQPGRWDTAVGGHVAFGEPVESALRREVKEELGLEDFEPLFVKRYVFESPREKELVNVYRTVYDGPVNPSDEVDDGRFWSREEIAANLGKGVFTPNFESEYKKVLKM